MLDKNEEMDTMEPHKLEIIDLLGEIGMFFSQQILIDYFFNFIHQLQLGRTMDPFSFSLPELYSECGSRKYKYFLKN